MCAVLRRYIDKTFYIPSLFVVSAYLQILYKWMHGTKEDVGRNILSSFATTGRQTTKDNTRAMRLSQE